jgi:hypothetical protein
VQGTILRFLPPYILLKSHVDETLEKLHSLLMAASPQPSATEYCVVPNREPVVEAVLQTAAPVA